MAVPPSTSITAARRKVRWREAIVVLIVLVGVIALGVLGPDRSKPGPSAPTASPVRQP